MFTQLLGTINVWRVLPEFLKYFGYTYRFIFLKEHLGHELSSAAIM